MSNYISVDVRADLDFYEIAEKMLNDSTEDEFLDELARQVRSAWRDTEHEGERAYADEYVKRLFELAKWAREAVPK